MLYAIIIVMVEILDKPWLDANPGEVWLLTQEEIMLWVALDYGQRRSLNGAWYLLEDEDIEAITQGVKIADDVTTVPPTMLGEDI